MEDIIILRTPYKFTKAMLNPYRVPGTRRYPDIVKKVDSKNEMILTDVERNSGKYFVAETDIIEIYDGKTFNLADEIDAAHWEAIKYNPLIAKDRNERDANGNLIIDGNASRYGCADWYVETPGKDTQVKNSGRRKKIEAQNYIIGDTPEERRLKARVLGKTVYNVHDSDIEDYLHQEAEKDPMKVIQLYTGGDMKLRILLLQALEDRIIENKNGLFLYGDSIMGSTEEACVLWMKQSSNKKMVKAIHEQAFPEKNTQEK